MNKIDRYKILIRYVVSQQIASSQKAFGAILGYTNESSFSQILNGKTKEPKDFMKRLRDRIPGLNTNWILTGEGEMIVNEPKVIQNNVSGDNINGHDVHITKADHDRLFDAFSRSQDQISASQVQITKSQEQLSKSQEQISISQAQLSKAQEQIDRLITIIEGRQRGE